MDSVPSSGPLAGLSPACHLLLEAKAKKGESCSIGRVHLKCLEEFDSLIPPTGLTFEKIAEGINKPEVWTAAVFYGQAKVCRAIGAPPAVVRASTDPRRPILTQPNPEDLGKLSEVLDLDSEQLKSSFGDHHMVHRGETWTWPPKVGSKDWARKTTLELIA